MVSCIISISYFVLRKLPCEAFTCTFVHMERDMILWRSAKILSLCGLPTSYSDWSGAWVLCVSHPALPALSTSRQQALTCLCTCVTVPSSSLVLDVQGGSTRTFITSEYIDDSEILVCHQIKQIKPDDRHWKSHSGAKSFFFFFFFCGVEILSLKTLCMSQQETYRCKWQDEFRCLGLLQTLFTADILTRQSEKTSGKNVNDSSIFWSSLEAMPVSRHTIPGN